MDWLPGAKEARMRAETVIRRRTAASALTTDLGLELEDLEVSLQLDGKDFQPADLSKFKGLVERAQGIMQQIYNDINLIADKPVPERITELQGFEFMQPALRIEARAAEIRKILEQAREARNQLNGPRENAGKEIAEAENQRLQAEIELAAARSIAAQLKAAYAENYPTVEAALLTAQSEVQAATQMVKSARQALGRKSWREAHDLGRRAGTIFESAAAKFQMIRSSQVDYSRAAQEADDALAAALRQLNSVRQTLLAQADTLIQEPSHYLNPAARRIGDARLAYKANPPQYVTALRLAREGLMLLAQAQSQAQGEIGKLNQSRLDARQNLSLLKEAVQNLRISLNSQRTVPVKANQLYEKARAERDRLLPSEPQLDRLSLPQLTELSTAARLALQTAQEGLKLVGF